MQCIFVRVITVVSKWCVVRGAWFVVRGVVQCTVQGKKGVSKKDTRYKVDVLQSYFKN